MKTSQARGIDPILTAVALGYESQQALVADILFPVVPVPARGGTIITFGREQFQVIDSRRAPGTHTKSVSVGYGSNNYSLVDRRLMGMVPKEHLEDAAAVPGIDLSAIAVAQVQERMDLEREVHAAALARADGAYAATNKTTLSGADIWINPSSNPFAIVNFAKEAIRKKIGRRPNVMELGPTVLTALRNHDKVMARLSNQTDKVPATLAQLQALFEIDQIIEGSAIADADGSFYDVWGNDAILAYISPKTLQQRGSRNYGYTYRLPDRPMVEEGYFEDENNSFMYPVNDASQAVLTCADSGFLIKNAVDAA